MSFKQPRKKRLAPDNFIDQRNFQKIYIILICGEYFHKSQNYFMNIVLSKLRMGRTLNLAIF